jgi:hypothetical protein
VVPPHLPEAAGPAHNDRMTVAWYTCRATWRQLWRTTLLVAVIGGLLGSVALGALAAARRTDSAYARYLHAVSASDVAVDIPGPVLAAIRHIEHAPMSLSSAVWVGMNAYPVINGKVNTSFQTAGLVGSLDGEFYRQDKVIALAGKLPPENATDEVMLSQSMAGAFRAQGVTFKVGDHMTWQFFNQPMAPDGLPGNAAPVAGRRVTFRIAAIVATSPALTDQIDDVPATLMPPGTTARLVYEGTRTPAYIEWQFGWVQMRLRGGDAGVPQLREWLRAYADQLANTYKFSLTFVIRQLAIVQHEAQQGIEPQVLALAALGGLTMLALLVLMVQGLAQLLSRSTADALTLRSLGAGRATAAAVAGAWAAVAVLGAVLLSVAGAIAVSPLAPVGPVRSYDPVRGIQADGLVLGGGAAALLVLLLAMLAWMAWRAVRQGPENSTAPVSALVAAAGRTGLPVTVVIGIRHALDRGTGRLRAPVRATIAGSVAAVTALVAALVFGASLTGLTTHPARYGWNWTVLVQSAGGWGSWAYGQQDPLLKLMRHQPGLTGWSELGFGQVDIRGVEVPVMGVETHPGQQTVEPPTTAGHPLAPCHQTNPRAHIPACNQIELGTVTMRQLGLRIGERVQVGSTHTPLTLTVVGTVTLPSVGVNLTDHPSLGRGALLAEPTMLRALGDPLTISPEATVDAAATVAYPATVVLDASSAPAAVAIGKRVVAVLNAQQVSAGNAYPLPPQLGAPVRNSSELGGQPLALAIGLAAAAVLALALTILASVRRRRRDLALLKALGLRARQIRAVVGWQTSTILLIAIAAGVPLGIAAGNWLWNSFANSLGVVPLPVVPAAELVAGIAALLVAGNLLALWPAHVAARIAPAAAFRTE